MRTIKRDIVGAFIFSSDEKLLLGKSRKGGVYSGHWVVPGGGVDPDETKLDGLKRELLEETGIYINGADIKQLEDALSGESEKTLKGTGEHVLVKMRFYNFVIKLPQTSNDVSLKTDDDFIDANWFARSELAALSLSPPTILTLKKLKLISS